MSHRLLRTFRLHSFRLHSPRSLGALVATTAVLAGTLAAGGAVTASAAVASTPARSTAVAPAAHNPKGAVTGDVATATGLTLTGWAIDPDNPTADAYVYALVDGQTRSSTWTSLPNAAITKTYLAGPTPGYTLNVPVPTGKHTVCVAVGNTGAGISVLLTCVATPLGSKVTAAQKAAHSPSGVVSGAAAGASSLHLTGFATDKDSLNKHLVVTIYVDGQAASTVLTSSTTTGAPKGSGKNARFDVTVPVSTGTHQACAWAVNVGWGHNTFLGCSALDTRAGQAIAAGSPSVTVLPKVLAEAEKHVGQRYVWGATGPKTFDCSGLVLYSYRKNGFVTPRVAQDQSLAARLIPASAARPGDLVFYHDTQGDVYHVGIYISPGLTVAAIDTAEGLNYQRIWDPSSATTSYGSFTHV